MGSSGSSSGGDSQTTIRYAGYIESHHSAFLANIEAYRNATVGVSPFTNYIDVEVDSAFFGTGNLISSFPSLYDIYGKFMAGLDVNALWTQVYDDTIDSTVVHNLVAAESALMDDDIETNGIPRMQVGMRDINAALSSSYVIGRAIIEDGKAKSLAKFSADLVYRLIPTAQARWQTHLQWNHSVVALYAEIMKFYFSAKTDVDEINYAMAAKDVLWPFTVLDFERAALGALQGATNSKTDVAGASTASKVIGGALSGAAMGAMVGSQIESVGAGYGAAGGAALGVAAALTY